MFEERSGTVRSHCQEAPEGPFVCDLEVSLGTLSGVRGCEHAVGDMRISSG